MMCADRCLIAIEAGPNELYYNKNKGISDDQIIFRDGLQKKKDNY